jgi:hypothetical protein
MKDELLPGLVLTRSGLLIDLDRRGQLDETLVVLLSEHGRTPKLASVQGGGRDHWSRCYSVVMAGGGVKRGLVLGKSDKIASDPLERRVSRKDILATIYHLLGIDPATTLTARPAHGARAGSRSYCRGARLSAVSGKRSRGKNSKNRLMSISSTYVEPLTTYVKGVVVSHRTNGVRQHSDIALS